MEQKKKPIAVTLELDPSLVNFYKRNAEKEGVTLEERLLKIAEERAKQEGYVSPEEVQRGFEEIQGFLREKGVVTNAPTAAFDLNYDPDYDPTEPIEE